ncbi:MAG: hypothetical protein GX207_10445 [Peptococcaceae bacterium]|nr:hypothetical protein [Peptococcaceae bacterium]
MPFTVSVNQDNNTFGTADVALTLSPTDALFSPANLVPGESLGSPLLNVSNSGTTDSYYFIFADWSPGGTTTPPQAQVLADRLNLTITVSPATELYNGSIADLKEQPPGGRLLEFEGEEDLIFVVSLPQSSNNLVEGLDLEVDLVFVAQSSPIS